MATASIRSFAQHLGYFVLVLGLAPAASAFAQAKDALRVERDAGSDDCPDATRLAERVRALRGAGELSATRYTVRFARDADSYSSQIRSGPRDANLRSIESRASDCSALAQATAVTLALLFDADAQKPARALEPEAQHPPTEPAKVPSNDGRTRASFSLGVGPLVAVLRPWAPALLAEAGVLHRRLRFGLGALWVPRQRSELAPGNVSEMLLSGSVRACYAPFASGGLRIDACSGVFVGALDARARGFTRNGEATRLFSALPVAVSFSQLGAALGWELSAALLIPFRGDEFTIDGIGALYRPPPIAALFTLRALGLIEL